MPSTTNSEIGNLIVRSGFKAATLKSGAAATPPLTTCTPLSTAATTGCTYVPRTTRHLTPRPASGIRHAACACGTRHTPNPKPSRPQTWQLGSCSPQCPALPMLATHTAHDTRVAVRPGCLHSKRQPRTCGAREGGACACSRGVRGCIHVLPLPLPLPTRAKYRSGVLPQLLNSKSLRRDKAAGSGGRSAAGA